MVKLVMFIGILYDELSIRSMFGCNEATQFLEIGPAQANSYRVCFSRLYVLCCHVSYMLHDTNLSFGTCGHAAIKSLGSPFWALT